MIGSVMAGLIYGREIPVVAGVPRGTYTEVRSGERVSLDASSGEVVARR